MRQFLLCGAVMALGLAMAGAAGADQPPAPKTPSDKLILLRPDLRITAMINYGSTVRIRVTNSGLAAAKKASLVRVWDVKQGQLVGVRFAVVQPLAKGQSQWVSVSFGSASLAQSTLFARADHFNVIAESNEANNMASKAIP